MFDDFSHMLWAYRAVFKQTAGGGGSIHVLITANERTVILYGTFGPNDYAANRTVTVRIADDDDNEIGRIFSNVAVDNAPFSFPVDDHSVVAAADGPQLEKRVVLGKGDYLQFIASGLVLNEELTVAIRALIMRTKPTIATTGSGGTVTITTTYDKVI